MNEKILNFGLFVPFGIPILIFDTIADLVYFWKNNFRTDLQKIIIQRENSTISHKSLREIMNICQQFSDMKIKSVNTGRLVKIFRKKFLVNQNLQFLLFGQIIPEGGFQIEGLDKGKSYTFKSMKTQELRDQREDEIQKADDSVQYLKSKHMLDQFN